MDGVINICFFTPSLNLGGYEKVIVNYANAFSSSHSVTILCGKKEGALQKCVNDNVKIINLNCRTRNYYFSLKSWIEKNDVDILYTPFITYTALAVLIKKTTKRSFVIYSAQHGYCDIEVPLFKRALRKLYKCADVHIAVTSRIADYFSSHYDIRRESFHIFDNPVYNSIDGIKYTKHEKIENAFAISGRLAKDKHVEIAIKIIEAVNKTHTADLFILGTGPLEQELRQYVCDIKADNYIHFVGYVECPADYLGRCKGLLLTSEVESFGNSVVEALLCGIPAIVTDCGGPVEIIEGDKYGVNIGRFDSKEVIENGRKAVIDILMDNIRFGDFGEKAKKYDAARLLGQFLLPYKEIRRNRSED